MSNDENKAESSIPKSNDIRSELQNLRSDVQDVKSTWENDRPNAKRTTKHRINKHSNKLLLLIAIAIPSYFWFEPEIPTIPQWTYVVGAGMVIGLFVGYPPAKYVVNKFVEDNRVPFLVTNPEDFTDVELHYVPKERVPNVEVYEGEKNRIETIKGEGFEVEKFEKIQYEGKEYLIAKGTWVGEKSGLELKRDEGAIAGMRETLKPLAMTGFAYELMWPHILHDLSSSIANMMSREFEDVAVFKGNELRNQIDGMIEKYKPDEIADKIDEKDVEDSDIEGVEIDIDDEEGLKEIAMRDS